MSLVTLMDTGTTVSECNDLVFLGRWLQWHESSSKRTLLCFPYHWRV